MPILSYHWCLYLQKWPLLLIFQLKFCMHLSPLPCVPHAPPILLNFISIIIFGEEDELWYSSSWSLLQPPVTFSFSSFHCTECGKQATWFNLPAIIVYTENCTATVGRVPRKYSSPIMVIKIENLLNTVNIGRLSSWNQHNLNKSTNHLQEV